MTKNVDEIRSRFECAEGVAPSDLPVQDNGPPAGYDAGDVAPPSDDGDPLNYQAGAQLPLNDTGNGKRFALYFGEDVIVVPRVGWHVWDGRRWRLDPDDIAVRRQAQKVQSCIVKEIPFLDIEPWQRKEIEGEAKARARKSELDAIALEARTPEQEIEREDLVQKLQWIRKLKDRKSSMKSDHRTFAKTTGNKGRIDAMLTEATVELAREVEDLDADPLTLNTESGILRFSVTPGGDGSTTAALVTVGPHQREAPIIGQDRFQYITKLMPVPYDPDATCPRFDAFLEQVQPSAEMRGFLQRWFGVSMTAIKVQKFAFFYGSGANGKSALVDLMARILGDYSASAKIESLTGRNRRGGGDATPDLIPLVGARMVRASEPEEGERLQENTIKELTGGEPIMVRKLHGDFVEVEPHFKLTISGNHKPDIRGTDDGIWRRVLLVPFDVQIPPEDRIPIEQFLDLLMQERAGIFRWLVDGLMDYLERGLQEPAQVLEATADYRADSDPIGAFLKDSCLVTGDPSDFLQARELIDGFNLWLDMRGDAMWGLRTVSNKLRDLAGRYRDPGTGKSFTKGKNVVTGYRGIRFQDMFAREFDDAPRNNQGRPVARTARSYGSDDGPVI
jgi:putative DNA primase/helicase